MSGNEVVETFFEDGAHLPCYRLMGGDIKKPYQLFNGAIAYMTDEEYDHHQRDLMRISKPFYRFIWDLFTNKAHSR